MPEILTNQTIEFKLPGNTIPPEWLKAAERVWNDALTLLNWRQHYLRYQECLEVPDDDNLFDLSHPVAIEKIKAGKDYYLHCWIGRDSRIDRSKSWDKDNIEFIPSVKLVRPSWNSPPPIDGRSAFTLCKQFTKKAGYDYSPLPSALMQSVIGNLADSWAKYIKTGAGKPKYKGSKNPITSISYDGFRSFCYLGTDSVKLVGLPEISVHGLSRLHSKIDRTKAYLRSTPSDRTLKAVEKLGLDGAADYYSLPGAYTLIKRASGDYIQFSGEFAVNLATAKTDAATVIVGGERLYSVSDKIEIAPHDNAKIERRIVNVQKILATKKTHSKNWHKLQDKIRDLQRRVSQSSRRHQQYHAQWLADRYGEINIDLLPPVVMPVPVPIADGNGNYAPNGATATAENNRQAARVATGQFIDLIKQQCNAKNRKFNGIIKKEPDTPISVINSPKPSEIHGQLESNDEQSGGNRKRLPTSKTRNRRREKAIG